MPGKIESNRTRMKRAIETSCYVKCNVFAPVLFSVLSSVY